MLDITGCRKAVTTAVAVTITMTFYVAYAVDPSPLQDFCVGVPDDNTTLPVSVNGLFCKDQSEVTSNDFVYHGFNIVANTSNKFGSISSAVNDSSFPALNTLGVSMSRVDFAPGGVNPLHTHPLASEMVTVLEGTLYVGFISSNLEDGTNTLYSAVITVGDIFVVPQGLVHFQSNIGDTPAVANAAFSSQNPGRIDVAYAAFESTPQIADYVLAKSFQVDESIVELIRSGLSRY